MNRSLLVLIGLVICGFGGDVLGQSHTINEEEALKMNDKDLDEMKADLWVINDLYKGIELAKEESKPIVLIFTAYGSVHARKLEQEVLLRDEKVYALMKEKYVNVWLYVDERKPEGKTWNDLQHTVFKGNHQPQIFVLDSEGKKLSSGMGYHESKIELLSLLENYVGN